MTEFYEVSVMHNVKLWDWVYEKLDPPYDDESAPTDELLDAAVWAYAGDDLDGTLWWGYIEGDEYGTLQLSVTNDPSDLADWYYEAGHVNYKIQLDRMDWNVVPYDQFSESEPSEGGD